MSNRDVIEQAKANMRTAMIAECSGPCRGCGVMVMVPDDIPDEYLMLLYAGVLFANVSILCDDCEAKESN